MVLGHRHWAVVGSQCFKRDPILEGFVAASERHEGVPWFSLPTMMRADPTYRGSSVRTSHPNNQTATQRIACICSRWAPGFKFVVTFHKNDLSFNIRKLKLIAVRWAWVSGYSTRDAKSEKIWTSPLPNICLGQILCSRDRARKKIHKVGNHCNIPPIVFIFALYLLLLSNLPSGSLVIATS